MYETAERALVTKYTFPALFSEGKAALIQAAIPPLSGMAVPSSVTMRPRGTANRSATAEEKC
jgi:hypothetical protein